MIYKNKHWAHLTWFFFHMLTLQTIKNEKSNYCIDFFSSFKDLIPCHHCRIHYQKLIHEPDEFMKSNLDKFDIFEWTIDLHNNVNKKNLSRPWNYSEARKFYESKKIQVKDIQAFIEVYHQYHRNKHDTFLKMIRSFFELLPDEFILKKKINLLFEKEEKNYIELMNEIKTILRSHSD
jgi:hypothetical protein